MGAHLCAICAKRRAEVLDEIDGHEYPVCRICRDGRVPEPPAMPTTRDRLLRVLRRVDCMDIQELAQVLGEDTELGRAKLSAALHRAIRDGLVTYSGNRMDREYRLVDRRPGAKPSEWIRVD